MEQQARTWNRRGSVLLLAVWTVGWVASLALAKFGSIAVGESQPVIGWALIAVNVAVGIGWIVAHAQYLAGVDELQRKILMDALAVALGVGVVGGSALAAASSAGLIAFDPDIGLLSIVMAVAYMLGVVVGTVRYR